MIKKILVLTLFTANLFSIANAELKNEDFININKEATKIFEQINNSSENKQIYLDDISEKIGFYEEDTKEYEYYSELKNVVDQIEIQKEEKYLTDNWYFEADYSEINNYWLDLLNKERENLWLDKYILNDKLNISSLNWAKESKNKWYIDHKRNKKDSYYNYKKIESWMKNNGVVCNKKSGKTFTESIWYWYFSCSDSDCTEDLKKWINQTFKFFMSEKWKKYNLHYRAIVSKYFSQIWLWIEVEKTWKNSYKYYLVNHYCTEVK